MTGQPNGTDAVIPPRPRWLGQTQPTGDATGEASVMATVSQSSPVPERPTWLLRKAERDPLSEPVLPPVPVKAVPDRLRSLPPLIDLDAVVELEELPDPDAARRWWIIFGTSVAVHSLVLVIMAILWPVDATGPTQLGITNAAFLEPEPIVEPDEIEPLHIEPVEPETLPDGDIAQIAIEDLDISLPAPDLVLNDNGEPTSRNSRNSDGDREAPLPGKPGTVDFFGTKATGNSFVFIIDASGSMDGPRFARARKHLADSLRQLKPHQKYLIILYNDGPFPLWEWGKRGRLQTATTGAINKNIRSLGRVQPQGGTNPLQAVQIGLGYKPDVVFLLTDGEIPPQTQAAVRQFNRNDAIVNTIAFGIRVGEPLLQEIAYENKGEYRFVR